MKKYRLLRDIPGVERGAIFLQDGIDGSYSIDHQNVRITKLIVENSPYWFEEIKERWEPKDGEGYWTIDGEFGVGFHPWDSGLFDNKKLKSGQVFRTKELAESAAKEVRAALDAYHEQIGE